MAAPKCNFLIVYKSSSQVFSSSSLQTALKSPTPKNCVADDRRILFITYKPDDSVLAVIPVSDEQIEKELDKINKVGESDEQDEVNDPAE